MSILEPHLKARGLGLGVGADADSVEPPLPPPRPLPSSFILPEGLDHQSYIKSFLDELGSREGQPIHFVDRAGNLLRLDGGVFEDRSGNPKSGKGGHGTFVRVVAKTIMDPDEIWETAGLRPPGKTKRQLPG